MSGITRRSGSGRRIAYAITVVRQGGGRGSGAVLQQRIGRSVDVRRGDGAFAVQDDHTREIGPTIGASCVLRGAHITISIVLLKPQR